MTRNFTKKITTDELAEKIWKAWRNHSEFDSREDLRDIGRHWSLAEKAEHYSSGIGYASLTPQVTKDLAKVEFDCENINADPNDAWMEESEYIGLHTLDNGLSYLGVQAGGDWESSLFFIIYHDGRKLRGYVPEKGNTWNTLNKKAVGNDDEMDKAFLKSKGLKDDDKLEADFKAIEGEIKEKIQYKESRRVK